MTTLIVACLLTIVISFCCSLSEAAVLSLNPLRLETLKKKGLRNIDRIIRMRQNVGRPIAAILILNTVANTAGSVVAGGAFGETFGDGWLWLFTAALTVVILLCCEILPKVIGVTHSERLLPVITPILMVLVRTLKPIIWVTEHLSRSVNPAETRAARYSADDISTLASLARQDNAIGADQEQIIVNAAKLRTLLTQDIMIPRESIVFLQSGASREHNYQTAQLALHTRYPVSETESPDGIIGYVNYKEILNANPDPGYFQIQPFLRQIPAVRPLLPAGELMKLLTQRRSHIAIVRDDGHRVVGLVTLEDILEELIGDIQDEFDWIPTEVVPICPGGWRIGGSTPMWQVQKAIDLPLTPEESGLSIAQWLQRHASGPVRPKLMVQHGSARFLVNKIRRRQILEVIVEARAHVPAATL